MKTIHDFASAASSFLWGPYFLIPLLLFTGFYLTVVLRGLQFRDVWHSLWLALVVRHEKDAEGDISHFQALAASSRMSQASARPASPPLLGRRGNRPARHCGYRERNRRG